MNTTRRHRKVLRDNIRGVTNPAIRRLCRRGGVKRLSGLIYEESRGVLKVFLENVIRDSVTYTEHSRRKTVTALDVVYALKRQGRDLYGFGGYDTNGKTRVNKRKITKNNSPQQHIVALPPVNNDVAQNLPLVTNDVAPSAQQPAIDFSHDYYTPFSFETDDTSRIRMDAENQRQREELEKKKKTLDEMQRLEKNIEQIQKEFERNEANKLKSEKITQKFNALKQKLKNKQLMDSIREMKMKKNLQKQVQGLEEMNDFQKSIDKLEKEIHDKVSRRNDLKSKAQQIKELKKKKDEIREEFKTLLSTFKAELDTKIDSINNVVLEMRRKKVEGNKQKTPSPILQVSPQIDDSGMIFDHYNTDINISPQNVYNDADLQLEDVLQNVYDSHIVEDAAERIHQNIRDMLDTFLCRKNFNNCLSLGLNSYDVLQSLTLSDITQVLRQNNSSQVLKLIHVTNDRNIKTVLKSNYSDTNRFTVMSYLIETWLLYFNRTPHLIPVLHLYKYNLPVYFERLKSEKRMQPSGLRDFFERIDPKDAWDHLCYDMKQFYAIEHLFVPNTISLKQLLERDNNERAEFMKSDIVAVFLQIYSFFYIYQNVLTHNTLLRENILLFRIPNHVFHFSYNIDDKNINFNTNYLVKIINFQKCYILNHTSNLCDAMNVRNKPQHSNNADLKLLFRLKNENFIHQNPELDYLISRTEDSGQTINDVFRNLVDIIRNDPLSYYERSDRSNQVHYQIDCTPLSQQDFFSTTTEVNLKYDSFKFSLRELQKQTQQRTHKYSRNMNKLKNSIVNLADIYRNVLVKCSNINMCLNFGFANKQIIQFLSTLNHLKVINKIERMDSENRNGIIHVLTSHFREFTCNSILKSYKINDVTSKQKDYINDNLLYEFLIGKSINNFKITPNFIETLNLYKYNSPMSHRIFINTKDKDLTTSYLAENVSIIKPEELENSLLEIIKDTCSNPESYCIESLYVSTMMSVSSFLSFHNPHFASFWEKYAITTLFQTYSTLFYYRNIFSHNDLHSGNVLCSYDENYIFRFVYTPTSHTRQIIFYSPYLVKIIDYGRCVVKETSDFIFSEIVKHAECFSLDKREILKKTGYRVPGMYYQNHNSQNRHTEDIRLFTIYKSYIFKDRHNYPLPRDFIDEILFNENIKNSINVFKALEYYLDKNKHIYNDSNLHKDKKIKGTFIIHPNDALGIHDSQESFTFLSETERFKTRVLIFPKEMTDHLHTKDHFLYIEKITPYVKSYYVAYELLLKYEVIVPYKCILKINHKKNESQNIVYEWYMSSFVNNFTQCPNTFQALNLYRMTDRSYDKFIKIQAYKEDISNLTKIDTHHESLKKHLTSDATLFCMERSNCLDYRPLAYFVNTKNNDNLDCVTSLFQLYAFLNTHKNIFTHYDLTLDNILLCYTDFNRYHFKYIYKYENDVIFEFASSFLVKIINCSNCYIKTKSESFLSHASSMSIEEQKEHGLFTVLQNTRLDHTQDLTPLRQLQPYTGMFEPTFMDQIVNKVDTEITTIDEAYRYLFIYCKHHYKDSKRNTRLFGTFEIHTDVIESIRSVTDPKVRTKKAYTFTLNEA